MTTCNTCGNDVDPLAVFPGGICLSCYEVTPEANAPLTMAGLLALTKVWGGR